MPAKSARYLLGLLLAVSVMQVSSQPGQADNSRPESISAQPFALDDWQLERPEQIRFGVVTTVWENGTYQRSILNRIQAELPQRQAQGSGHWAPPAATPTEPFLIASFAHGLANRLGGGFGSFAAAPSQAMVSIQAQALLIQTVKEASGYAGCWIQLMPGQGQSEGHRQSTYLDARAYAYLTFEAQAMGDFSLKLADRHWHQKDDSLALGPLASYRLPQDSGSDWQKYALPLDQIRSLDRAYLANLAFEAIGKGAQQLKLRNLQLSPVAEPALTTPEPANLQQQRERSIWVWNTADLIKDSQQMTQTLDFLQAQGFKRVFLQLPAGRPGLPGEVSFDSEALATLLRAFHSRDIQVEALDGDPRYAQQTFHAGVLATLQRVLKHNQQSEPAARFDGLQVDIEPYLLPGFFSWQRQALLSDYLQLLSQLYQRSQAAGLRFGVAVPHWLDQPDEFSGQPNWFAFAGENKPLHELIQDRSDYLALMDYRTQIWGQGGILAAAFQELDYANRHHKQVVIGLETMPLPDEQLFLLQGQPQRQRPSQHSLVIFNDGQHWQQAYLAPDQVWEAPDQAWFWPLKAYAQTAGSDLSFAGQSLAELNKTLETVSDELGLYQAFGGIALHHSGSYADLVKDELPSQQALSNPE